MTAARRATRAIRPRLISRPRWARRPMPAGSASLDPRAAAVALSARAVLRPALLLLRLQHQRGPARHLAPRLRARCIEREIALVAAFIGRRARVSHIHWGGGTPTSLPGDRLISVMNLIRKLFAVDADAEIAIELDPTSLPEDRLDALSAWGSRASASACRTSSPRCRRRSAASNPTSRPRPAPRRRARSASIRSTSTSSTACRCRPRKASRAPRGARSSSAPIASRCSATPTCRG